MIKTSPSKINENNYEFYLVFTKLCKRSVKRTHLYVYSTPVSYV